LVPGYGTISNETEIFNLRQEIDTLSQALAAQQRYNESFRRLLVGEVQTVEDIPQIQYEPGDSSAQIERIEEDEALRREVELEAIREINELNRSNSSNAPVPLEQIFFTPPVTGEISAGFMPDKGHQGVDILAPKNTPIKVVMDGVVIASDWTLETGNTIGILHENDIVTFYKHNSVLLKKVGNIVQAGEAVAIIGNTGTLTDGPHLHFELWYQGVPVDPEGYINFN
ncbi:MAG: M23 family metallopeptidase, partial [Bacteroidota bacterium]